MTADQQEWIQGLRDIADWFEQHPGRIDGQVTLDLYPGGKEKLAQLTREFGGSVEKNYSGSLFYVRRRFGPHRVDGNVSRREVCRRVVTGTKQVAEQIVPAHEEEIVEWVCDEPLLAVKT